MGMRSSRRQLRTYSRGYRGLRRKNYFTYRRWGSRRNFFPRVAATLTAPRIQLKALDCSDLTLDTSDGSGANSGILIRSDFSGAGTGRFIVLNTVIEGSGFNQRVGRTILMRSLKLEFTIAPNPNAIATATQMDVLRLIIFYDRQFNTAVPTTSTLLQDFDVSATNYTDIFAGINLNYRDRFQILLDRKIHLPQQLQSGTGVTGSLFPNSYGNSGADNKTGGFGIHQHYLKLKNLVTQYAASGNPTPLDSSIATGALVLFVLGNNVASAAGWYINKWHTRLRYVDG